MALPKLEAPVYELTLPVSKRKIKFRPFLVKEQKILMMALESGDSETNERNIKQILQNCVITELDVDDLSLVDVEFYLLNLRARSIGEIVESKYKCENKVGDKECGNFMDVSFNLLELDVKNLDNDGGLIKITDEVSIKMKYPEYSLLTKMQNTESASDIVFELIASCVDYILEGENFYYGHETPKEEIIEFLETLNTQQFNMVEEFFDTLPVIEKFVKVKCNKCGFDHEIEIRGLDNFFG